MTNNSFYKIAEALFFLGTSTVGYFFCFIVAKYYLNKPPGLQSLHSKVLVLFLITYGNASANITLGTFLSLLASPMSGTMSVLLAWIRYASGIVFILGMLAVVVVKYLSVFHGSWIQDWNDNSILKALSMILILAPWPLTLLEFGYLSDMTQDSTYQLFRYGHELEGGTSEKTVVAGMLINMFTIVTVQIRLELSHQEDGLLAKLNKWIWANSNKKGLPVLEDGSGMNSSDYKMGVLRIMVAVTGIVTLAFIITGTGRFGIVLLHTFFSFVCPFIYVVNHQGMKKTLYSYLNVK